jgi:rhodanese-related sulfurtransferase
MSVVPEIDLQTFAAAHADGVLVLDVREPYEYVDGHVPGAVLLPLAHVHSRLDHLPQSAPVYVICATGNRSKTAASWLRAAGIDAISVSGGTGGWSGQGRPLARGQHAHESAA